MTQKSDLWNPLYTSSHAGIGDDTSSLHVLLHVPTPLASSSCGANSSVLHDMTSDAALTPSFVGLGTPPHEENRSTSSSSPGSGYEADACGALDPEDDWHVLSELLNVVPDLPSPDEMSASIAGTPQPAPVIKSEPVKEEPTEELSAEEAKKKRRRSQIASSVQRHRERKRKMMSALKLEFADLTDQLEKLRSQRKNLHYTSEAAAWEEEAAMQRRKRLQSEALNLQMKRELFEQTSFLSGFQSMLMRNSSSVLDMDFHQWIHSYTVITAADPLARQRQYVAALPVAKLELAMGIVMRETESVPFEVRNGDDRFFASVDVLEDSSSPAAVAAFAPDAQSDVLMKKYTAVFAFQENEQMTFDRFYHAALEATKGVGVFWPAEGYTARCAEVVDIKNTSRHQLGYEERPDEEVDDDHVFYTDLHLHVPPRAVSNTRIAIESRMLCRSQKRADVGIIVWDYIDRDVCHPHDEHLASNEPFIRRDGCGAVIVQRESNGRLTLRSVSVKRFVPGMREAPPANKETLAYTPYRSHQAQDAEQRQVKCSDWVYEHISRAIAT